MTTNVAFGLVAPRSLVVRDPPPAETCAWVRVCGLSCDFVTRPEAIQEGLGVERWGFGPARSTRGDSERCRTDHLRHPRRTEGRTAGTSADLPSSAAGSRGRLGRLLGGIAAFEVGNVATTLLILRTTDLLTHPRTGPPPPPASPSGSTSRTTSPRPPPPYPQAVCRIGSVNAARSWFGDLRAVATQQLPAEQPAGATVPGDPDRTGVAPG
jgi:hypothetical protein